MLPLRIAIRYLFSPKSHNAINAITLVAAFGVVIITAAMVCVLSVYNGFEDLVRSLTSRIDPDIRVEAAEGRFFHDSDSLRQVVLSHPDVTGLSPMLEEQVLLSYSGQQLPALARGVDDSYFIMTGAHDCLLSARNYALASSYSDSTAYQIPPTSCIPGVGLAVSLGLMPGMVRPVALYLPQRDVKFNASMLGSSSFDESSAFQRSDLFVCDFLQVSQAEYDDQLVLLPLDEMQALEQDSTLISSYELLLRAGADPERVKEELNRLLPTLHCLSAADLQADAYRIMRIEKWITYLLILFILLIASFNIIGALSMLIIDKQQQTQTLLSMGAPQSMVRRIFLWLGLLISGFGTILGTILGVGLVLAQQHFGLITLGSDAIFVVSAYPVQLLWSDVVLTIITVMGLGSFATLYTNSFQRLP